MSSPPKELSPGEQFQKEKLRNIHKMQADPELKKKALDWIVHSGKYRYSYHFSWLGRPIIQFPQDIIAIQELIWRIKPDFVVETGIAHGGSIILSASILELIGGNGRVIGIDIDIREHNRIEIEKHPMARRITMIQGSSVSEETARKVHALVKGKGTALVILDSNHTHDHVLRELQIYSPLVNKNSYCVVFDTVIENMPDGSFSDRPWGKNNNPKTAVETFLKTTDRFEVDTDLEAQLLITVAPGGYLKCIKD